MARGHPRLTVLPQPHNLVLRQRVATAVIGIPVLIALVLAGGALFTAVAAVALAFAGYEFFRAAGFDRSPGAALGVALCAAAAIAVDAGDGWPQGLVAATVALPLLWPVFAARTETALRDWSVVAGGALYVGWLGAHLVLVRDLPDGRDWLLLGLFSIFATDTGAYFIGRAFGRRKMAPVVSPKKTWEGGAGGWACGFATVLALNAAFGLDAPPAAILGLAALLPVVAELGDLAESALKRSMAVKDMGGVLPGHGGLVDRLDSILFAVPMLYYWVRWVVM